MSISTDKQIVLVVGGSHGIGYGLVERALNGTGASWIHKDALVVATGKDKADNDKLLKLQTEYKDRLYIEVVEVSCAESINKFVDTINNKYPRLDVLFYNAGVCLDNPREEYAKFDRDIYIKTHIINVIGPQHICFGLSKLLNKTHELLGGRVGEKPTPLADDETKDDMTKVRVIFTGSGMGSLNDHNYFKDPIYRTSKGALNHVARDISLKFPHFCTVVFHPGAVKTRLTGGEGELTVEESTKGVYEILDKEAYAVNSMKYMLKYDGTHLDW